MMEDNYQQVIFITSFSGTAVPLIDSHLPSGIIPVRTIGSVAQW